jgi:hypothetical protein
MGDLKNSKTKTIDDVQFEVGCLGIKQGRRTWIKLVQAIGPSFAAMHDQDLAGAASLIASQTALPDFFEEIIDTFAQVTLADGRPLVRPAVQEEYFAGKITLTLKWLQFALEVNYGDFFELLASSTAQVDLAKATA